MEIQNSTETNNVNTEVIPQTSENNLTINPEEEEKRKQLEAEEEERRKQIRLSRFGKVDETDYNNDIMLGSKFKKIEKKEKDLTHLLEVKPLFSRRSNIPQDPVYVDDPEKIFTSKSKDTFKLEFINDPPLLDKRKVSLLKLTFILYIS